jgi:uncharacterized SAM-binding protein YcdF (DUF218 family)
MVKKSKEVALLPSSAPIRWPVRAAHDNIFGVNDTLANFIFPLFQPLGLLWVVLLTLTVICFLKRGRVFGSILLLVCLALFAAGSTRLPYILLNTLERPYIGKTVASAHTADAVLVLGGSQHFSANEPFHLGLGDSGSRIVTAVELMRRHKAGSLVLGGGSYTVDGRKKPESELLRDWLESWKVCGDAPIMPLEVCQNTHDEVLQIEKLAREHHWRRILLVTSAFHLRRAEGLFRQIGLSVEVVACDFRADGVQRPFRSIFPAAQSIQAFELYLHEFVGWYIYRWRGWVKE